MLLAVLNRRVRRVQIWAEAQLNVKGLDGNPSVKGTIEALTGRVRAIWLLCGSDGGGNCSRCFLPCLHMLGHAGEHDCYGNHTCVGSCAHCRVRWFSTGLHLWRSCTGYCSHCGGESAGVKCVQQSGHARQCLCAKKHVCGSKCEYEACVCGRTCTLNVGHAGAHSCQDVHVCGEPCCVPGCTDTCAAAVINSGPHPANDGDHLCGRKQCTHACGMDKCNRGCSKGHQHADGNDLHQCDAVHTCAEDCAEPGICFSAMCRREVCRWLRVVVSC